MRLVMVPGIDGSDAEHWQTRWECAGGGDRIAPASWTEPDLTDWTNAISTAVGSRQDAVLVAHSLGCLAVARWLGEPGHTARAVLLVAPPDPTAPTFPASAAPTFADFDPRPLAVPGLVVTSTDDPYCTPEAARELSERWRLRRIDVGPHGHLNSASNLGNWPRGRALLNALLESPT